MTTEFYSRPFLPSVRRKVEHFLAEQGLSFDDGTSFTVVVYGEGGEIAATGSLEKNILKCIAVSESHRGEGLTATVVSALCGNAFEHGEKALLLFTKPKNAVMFAEFGFSPLSQTADMLLMESPGGTLQKFIENIPHAMGEIGAVVANCNPFTNGHRYLMETAAKACDTLYVFVLSEEKSLFSAAERMEMVRLGVADLPNVIVCPTSDYLVSSATFPTYFLKQSQIQNGAGGALDLQLFGEYFAPALGIKTRFVGDEPFSPITALYNRQMHEILPKFGIKVAEMPRKQFQNTAISASNVRALLAQNNMAEIQKIVPPSTYNFLLNR